MSQPTSERLHDYIELIADLPTEDILAAAWDCGTKRCPYCEHREKVCDKYKIGASALGLALIRLTELYEMYEKKGGKNE